MKRKTQIISIMGLIIIMLVLQSFVSRYNSQLSLKRAYFYKLEKETLRSPDGYWTLGEKIANMGRIIGESESLQLMDLRVKVADRWDRYRFDLPDGNFFVVDIDGNLLDFKEEPDLPTIDLYADYAYRGGFFKIHLPNLSISDTIRVCRKLLEKFIPSPEFENRKFFGSMALGFCARPLHDGLFIGWSRYASESKTQLVWKEDGTFIGELRQKHSEEKLRDLTKQEAITLLHFLYVELMALKEFDESKGMRLKSISEEGLRLKRNITWLWVFTTVAVILVLLILLSGEIHNMLKRKSA